MFAACGVTAVLHLLAYQHHTDHPHLGGSPGWWTWFDQERYFRAATAWAKLDLDPAQHWYLPGYPLLAAPFIPLLGVHAFLPVDLGCLLVSLWLFSALAARLSGGMRHGRALGAVLFTCSTAVSPLGLNIWVVPWSTTGAVPLVYACLLATVCCIERPRRWGFGLLAGLCGALAVAFRPTDTVPLLLSCAAGLGVTVATPRLAVRLAVAGVAGVALGLTLVVAAYLPIYGLRASDYIASSGMIGFEWRLIPLHWVTLMLDPQPLLAEGMGIVQAFPWIVAGFAGMAVHLVCPPRGTPRAPHVAVVLAAALHMALYLAYRDLHPGGLFQFWNYHYLKWVYPVLALYGVLWLRALLAGRRLPALAVSAATLLALLPWRAELHPVAGPPAIVGDGLTFESGLTRVQDGMLVAAAGEADTIYFGPHRLTIDGQVRPDFADFRTFPHPGGFLIVPLRPLPAGPAALMMRSGIRLDPSVAPIPVWQAIVFGVPCWPPSWLHACTARRLLPPPRFPPDGVLPFDGAERPFLTGRWQTGEAHGRWTDGRDSGIAMRLDEGGEHRLSVEASAFVPPGAPPLEVHVMAGGHEVFRRAFTDETTVTLDAAIPAAELGGAELILHIDNPRAPHDYDPASPDLRVLGLFVREISLRPVPAD